MNVVLIGYRGTGKSSVASRVAEQLTLRVMSLDAELVRRAGRSVPEIVAERGWPGFRDLEEQVVADAARLQGYVIDCGGGVVEREANFPVLRAAGRVIWLTARPDTIVRRIGGDTQRPSLTGQKSFTEEVVEVLARREPLYRRLAHAVVATDDRSLGAIAADVVREARS
jgi:shikimate kinase